MALLLLATPAAADIVSAQPDTTAVTIYRDEAIPDPAAADWNGGYGLAMIRETRTVDLPAGQTRLVLEGVADGALPETAALEGLPGRIVEQNFDFNLLTPGSLIQHSVGRPVQLVRTNPKTGKRKLEDAVLRSGSQGVVLDVGGRTEALGCSGDLEGLIFPEVPPELNGKAALSTVVRVDRPGRYRLSLSYLTVGLAWRAAYVATVAPDAASLDLTGWITLANHGDTTFADAPTSVVAGRLARQAVQIVDHAMAARENDCWPLGNSHHPHGVIPPRPMAPEAMNTAVPAPMEAMAGLAEVTVTARKVSESRLGDYKLYTLGEPTTVAARQTKQVEFLRQPGVKFDRVYVYQLDSAFYDGAHDEGPTTTTLRFENKPENGLGRALPAGNVSVRQALGDEALFIGEPSLHDVPVGGPFELTTGEASDVRVGWRVVSVEGFKQDGRDGERAQIEADLTNAKGEPVNVEVRQTDGAAGFKVVAETQPHGTKAGDPVWRVPVPANGDATLTYTVSYLTD